MKIILIRHVQTEKNKKGILISQRDSDITEEGLDQIKKIISKLSNEKISTIYCSKLGRSVKTAEAISKAYNVNLKFDDRLKELNWGGLTDIPVKEVISKWTKYYGEEKARGVPRENIRPKNGENSFDHAKRVDNFIKEITKKYKNETIVIVGHSGTNKVFIGLLKNLDPEQFYEVKQDNGCINYIELDEKGKLTIYNLNYTDHLKNK
ncbi:MAG: histidine phosphatase family protein [Nanoarchaeota archaeon]